ncbi:MAG: CinA family nicotinamide mononucleotide deamidase-related protein [Planctomycetota bacterium]
MTNAEMMTHERAAIVSIGDELILGQALDTNTHWLAQRLTERGIRVVEHVTVDDDRPRIDATLRRLAGDVQCIIMTGGLGPTADDLTREALADAMGQTLIEDPQGLAWLEAIEQARGRTLTAQRRVQAQRPQSASLLPNEHGTAPGIRGAVDGADVFCLPGPPREMRPMFEQCVEPVLLSPDGRVIRASLLRTFGLPESVVAERLGALMDRDANPTVGTTASGGVVTVRIRFEGAEAEAAAAMEAASAQVRTLVGDVLFGEGETTVPSALVDALRTRGERVLVVESCTAGLIGAMIAGVPGASDVFLGGWLTYANAMKSAMVGVPAEWLDMPPGVPPIPGAVSTETAVAMAEGALRVAAARGIDAHHALSVTGVAGPRGGTDDKPRGTVVNARATRGDATDVRHFLIAGDRSDVRERSATTAMGMLLHHLRGGVPDVMTWQMENA